MCLFSSRVQIEFVPRFPCQFLTFPLFVLAVVCQYFPDLPGLVPLLSVVQQLGLDHLPVPLFVVGLLLKIGRRCCLSRIVLVPVDPPDRYRCRCCQRLEVDFRFLPIPEYLLGKVVQL